MLSKLGGRLRPSIPRDDGRAQSWYRPQSRQNQEIHRNPHKLTMTDPLASRPETPVPEVVSKPQASPTLFEVALHYDMPLSIEIAQRLEAYCHALWAWNEKVNLTRHTDFETFVARDLSDVLALSRHLRSGEQVLDVGTGGGVPGIPLGIIRDDLRVVLCETVAKKTKVLQDILRQMKLPMVVHTARGEDVLKVQRFNSVVARAVGPLDKILRWFQGSWHAMDRLLLIKGPRWVEERGEARHRGLMNKLDLRRLEEYANPITGVRSVILQLTPKPSTS